MLCRKPNGTWIMFIEEMLLMNISAKLQHLATEHIC